MMQLGMTGIDAFLGQSETVRPNLIDSGKIRICSFTGENAERIESCGYCWL